MNMLMTQAEKYANDMLTLLEMETSHYCVHSSREAHTAAAKKCLELQVEAIMKASRDAAMVYDLSFFDNDFWKDVLTAIDKL